MCVEEMTPTRLAAALRSARQAAGLSVAELAAQGGVSPRLVSEFERGMRPHVSLDTALRLLQLVGVPLHVAAPVGERTDDEARSQRAELRRRTWVGQKSTMAEQAAPAAPTEYADRLGAVAHASLLAAGLEQAYREATVASPTTPRSRTRSRTRSTR